jgi:hypothetical protein
LAVIFLYAGSHALYYRPSVAALEPLAKGMGLALLAISFLGLTGLAYGWPRAIRRRLLLWLIKQDAADNILARHTTTPRGMMRSGHMAAAPATGSRSVRDRTEWAALHNWPSHPL